MSLANKNRGGKRILKGHGFKSPAAHLTNPPWSKTSQEPNSSASCATDEPSARLNYCARCNNQRRAVWPLLTPAVFMGSGRWHNLWGSVEGR